MSEPLINADLNDLCIAVTKNMEIRKYKKEKDESKLIEIIELEGEEWTYTAPHTIDKYKMALENSITYVAYKNDELCGFSRSINDNDLYVYVCDLLVTPKFRGQNIGKQLMECLYDDFSDATVFVMSDVDEYYKKIGYRKKGSVLEVSKKIKNR
ncbi:MAG: GNAT family N-acetyltransferase [Firmicutes bacterium]|nr:GNAT family N-acetyltransferase [Bacillota bacterium]